MSVFAILGEIVAGWLIADLIGGLLHWWEDRAGERRWPIVGKWVVEPNRLHHRDPLAFTRAGFISRNSTTWAAVAVVSVLWLALLGGSVCWAVATIGGLLTNQVHYWAHSHPAVRPVWVSMLQFTGLFQSSQHHGHHHRYTDRGYCILTNLLNPILDQLRVWDRLERLLALLRMPVNGGTR